MPTAPSKREASSRCDSVAWRPAAIADAPRPTSAGVFGIARTTGRPGARASSDAIVTPAAIDSTRVSLPNDDSRRLQARRDVAGLDRDHHDVGIRDCPRGGRHHSDLRELLFELPPPVGIDLGDGDLVGVPPAVEQAAEQGGAHPAAPINATRVIPRVTRRAPSRSRPRRSDGNCRARGTFGTTPHFPERDRPSRTSGPAASPALRRRRRR